jgi:hypothetical protein
MKEAGGTGFVLFMVFVCGAHCSRIVEGGEQHLTAQNRIQNLHDLHGSRLSGRVVGSRNTGVRKWAGDAQVQAEAKTWERGSIFFVEGLQKKIFFYNNIFFFKNFFLPPFFFWNKTKLVFFFFPFLDHKNKQKQTHTWEGN